MAKKRLSSFDEQVIRIRTVLKDEIIQTKYKILKEELGSFQTDANFLRFIINELYETKFPKRRIRKVDIAAMKRKYFKIKEGL